jgi:hypothetical protein
MNKLIPVSAILLGFLGIAAAQEPVKNPTLEARDSSVSLIDGYKKWAKVNPAPFRVSSVIAFLCGRPSPQQVAKIQAEEDKDPHKIHSNETNDSLSAFISVYVDSLAADAMLHQKTPYYPVGSVIVKEKLLTADSKSPVLLTVMEKREKGYNPESCQSCHVRYKDDDYVTRTYLSDELQQKLK